MARCMAGRQVRPRAGVGPVPVPVAVPVAVPVPAGRSGDGPGEAVGGGSCPLGCGAGEAGAEAVSCEGSETQLLPAAAGLGRKVSLSSGNGPESRAAAVWAKTARPCPGRGGGSPASPGPEVKPLTG